MLAHCPSSIDWGLSGNTEESRLDRKGPSYHVCDAVVYRVDESHEVHALSKNH